VRKRNRADERARKTKMSKGKDGAWILQEEETERRRRCSPGGKKKKRESRKKITERRPDSAKGQKTRSHKDKRSLHRAAEGKGEGGGSKYQTAIKSGRWVVGDSGEQPRVYRPRLTGGGERHGPAALRSKKRFGMRKGRLVSVREGTVSRVGHEIRSGNAKEIDREGEEETTRKYRGRRGPQKRGSQQEGNRPTKNETGVKLIAAHPLRLGVTKKNWDKDEKKRENALREKVAAHDATGSKGLPIELVGPEQGKRRRYRGMSRGTTMSEQIKTREGKAPETGVDSGEGKAETKSKWCSRHRKKKRPRGEDAGENE